ncbi:MAG TPA: outer membrane beta-barrel protein [Thermoanaerobaculia bacterium]
MRFVVVLLLFTSQVFTSQAIAAPVFVRVGAGDERGRDTAVRDRDCTATQPPALFGCGFEAAGDFGRGPSFEVAAGTGSRARVELALAYRALDLDATANFTGVPGDQPVRAEGRSLSATVNGTLELTPQPWRVRAFLTAGAGVARNTTGEVVYSFPGIGDDAVTIARGGAHTGFAWNAGLGATFAVTDTLSLDLAFRHTDLGTVRSPRGVARIVRPTRTLELEIDETRARAATRGVTLSLRWTR